MSDADIGASAAPPGDMVSGEVSLDAPLTEGRQTFDRAAMQQAREEAARYRHEAKDERARAEALATKYEVFEQANPEDTDTWIGFAQQFPNDPQAVAQQFLNIANSILEDPTSTKQEKVEATEMVEQAEAVQAALTPETVKTMVDEVLTAHDQKSKDAAAVADVHRELADAGYPEGTLENKIALLIATSEPEAGGTVAGALEYLAKMKQAQIDEYVSGVTTGAAPTAAPADGVAPSPAAPDLSDLDDGFKSAAAFIQARQDERRAAL